MPGLACACELKKFLMYLANVTYQCYKCFITDKTFIEYILNLVSARAQSKYET